MNSCRGFAVCALVEPLPREHLRLGPWELTLTSQPDMALGLEWMEAVACSSVSAFLLMGVFVLIVVEN